MERLEILEQLERGEISQDDASAMLSALDSPTPELPASAAPRNKLPLLLVLLVVPIVLLMVLAVVGFLFVA